MCRHVTLNRATYSAILFIIEKLRWYWISGVVLGSGIPLHEPPLVLTAGIADVYHLEIHSLALHNELSLHLSLFHLKKERMFGYC